MGIGATKAKLQIVDPTAFSEAQFEVHVQDALGSVFEDYYCIRFRGEFEFDGVVKEADLALVHKNFTHWFVIEVELVSHSLHGHVLPQVTCFVYGKPLASCVSWFQREIPNITQSQAVTLAHLVPRSVAVIANRTDPEWIAALRAVTVQFMAVSVFEGAAGNYAVEADGSLDVPRRSLGFFPYSAANRSIRLNLPTELEPGELSIEDPNGVVGVWTVRYTDEDAWVTKNIGDPGIADRAMLQIVRTQSGKITLRAF